MRPDKGKPAERRGRKAEGLRLGAMVAGLPDEYASGPAVCIPEGGGV
jgi:hypothetical protein